MDKTAIARRRVAALGLSGDPAGSAREVVGRLGAVQSQDFGPSKWSVGQRTAAPDDEAITSDFNAGTILRTHVLRPTWHFVLPEDLRWMLDLTGPRVRKTTAGYLRRQGLDRSVLENFFLKLPRLLQDRRFLTRHEMSQALDKEGVRLSGLPLGLALIEAELTGLVCSGPLKGKQHTYALLSERAPATKRPSRDEALAELTVRYFTGHGPATIKDFAWWSSLTVTDIRRGLEMVAGQLQRERIEDVEYWSGGSEVPPDSERVHLIHTFDELIVGYSETKHLIDLEGVAAGSETGIYAPSIVVDGQVAGVWKRSMEGHNLRLDLTHYKRLADETSAALGSATERLGRFFGHANPLVAMQYARDDGRPRGP